MTAKQVIFDAQARHALHDGVGILARAVRTTLGPKGRNVALGKKYGAPTISPDGVTVAKEIELKDPFQNMGAQLLKQAEYGDLAQWGIIDPAKVVHAALVNAVSVAGMILSTDALIAEVPEVEHNGVSVAPELAY